MHITESALMCTSVTRHKKWLQFIHVSELVCRKSNPLCMAFPWQDSPYSQSMLFILRQSAVSPPFCAAETISRTSLSSSFSTGVSACWLKYKKTSV